MIASVIAFVDQINFTRFLQNQSLEPRKAAFAQIHLVIAIVIAIVIALVIGIVLAIVMAFVILHYGIYFRQAQH